MNRNDAYAVRTIIAQHVNERVMRLEEMPMKTKADVRAKTKLAKELDAALKLYEKLDPGPYKPAKQPKLVKVGECVCGEPVSIGERYAVKVDGTTTISRRCQSCGRTNDVDLEVSRRVQPVDWKIRDCFCGGAVRTRSDYAGSGFPSYLGPLDFAGRTRKNRTTTVQCSGCACKWTFQIRFAKTEDGKTQRTIPSQTVQRCRSCAQIELGEEWTTVPKKTKTAS